MHDEATTTFTQQVKDLNTNKKDLVDQLNNKTRENSTLSATNQSLQTKVQEKDRDNQRLQSRLSSVEGTLKAATSHLAKIDTEVSAARTDSKQAMDRAIAMTKERDDAVRAKNSSDKLLADANFKIKNFETQVGDQTAVIAMRDQTIREKDVILDLVNRRHPGLVPTLQPLVTGTVSRVSTSGKLVTISVQSGADKLKSGARFAIFNQAEGYKGEAVVSEVDGSGKFCFARLTLDQGKKISSGDSASTNLSSSGKGN